MEYFKDDFDFSELDENHEFYDTINKKVIGKMKIETSPIIELDNFVALRSKSYSFSYGATQSTVQKSKQKGIQHTPPYTQFINSLFNSETTTATNYSIRSIAHNLAVQKQDKLALNPFDDKRVYLNPIQSLSWDKHVQSGDCPCIFCLKLVGLYYKELHTSVVTSEMDGRCAELRLRDEEIYYNIWTLKEKLNHQQLLNLISDRALFIVIIGVMRSFAIAFGHTFYNCAKLREANYTMIIYYHHLLSSFIIIIYYHRLLSSFIIIVYYHSSLIHLLLSSFIIIIWYIILTLL